MKNLVRKHLNILIYKFQENQPNKIDNVGIDEY